MKNLFIEKANEIQYNKSSATQKKSISGRVFILNTVDFED